MNQIDSIINTLDLKSRWKMFLITLLAGFLMSAIPHLVKLPQLINLSFSGKIISPLSSKPKDPIEDLLPRLAAKPNSFSLIKETSIIPQTQASSDLNSSSGYAVVDFDSGKVIASKNLSKQLPIASLTKIMTAVVAIDLAEKTDELFTVSKSAANTQPTKIGVVEGQKMTLSDLLSAMILTSANDSTQVINEGFDLKYGQGTFIKAMNAKAVLLNLKNTHFENPQGFDGREHYSSPEDLAILAHYALSNYPKITEIAKKDYQFLPENSNHKQFDLYNWNGLLGVYPGVFGLKIGNTEDASYTTIVASERDGKKMLAVLLGAPGVKERDLWASQALDLGFQKQYGLDPISITEPQLKEKYSSWKYWN